MKVLVTGATGFLGEHVVSTLVQQGIDVVATGRDLSKLHAAPWASEVEVVIFDLSCKSNGLLELFHHPTHCIHLAWAGLPSYKSDIHLEENLPQSCDFLFQLIDEGLKHILVSGTCFEYGMQEGQMSESAVACPCTPYGIAKDKLRHRIEEYIKGKDILFQWPRIFYMYGPGQNPKSLFAQLQQAIDDGAEEFAMSGGEQIRDFLPVQEVAESLVDIACHSNRSGIVNVCSDNPLTVKQLVEDYLAERSAFIALNLGVYPYVDWEPFRFWGDNSILRSIRSRHGLR